MNIREHESQQVHQHVDGKLQMSESLYNEMLKFFRRTSLPRISLQRAEQKKKDVLSEKIS